MKKDPLMVEIGGRIRRSRHALGFTQQQLAEKVNVNVSFIGNVERGECAPSLDTLNRIAEALKVELKDLVDVPDEAEVERVDELLTLLREAGWEAEECRDVKHVILLTGRQSVLQSVLLIGEK